MKIRELFSDESFWTREVNARTKEGKSIDPNDNTAVCWCLGGAMAYCYPRLLDRMKVQEKIHNQIGQTVPIPQYNDNHTFENVKALVEELDI